MNSFCRFFRQLPLLMSALVLAPAVVEARSLPDFTQLVDRYAPAVVNISTHQKRPTTPSRPRGFSMPDLPQDSPFNDFFRRFLEEGPLGGFGGEVPKGQGPHSLGSGFIISADGYILTNHHVVADAAEVVVRLNDRREFIAEVVGSDKRSDTAVLKIEATDLPTVALGSSKNLKVGEWVLAIGSPFGFDHTVTAGIVSAKGRSLPSENYVPFIQTDVAINPGNSGGPLFNLDGEVVGINSQIYSETGSYMGLSFAIPIETAVDVSRQLRKKGKVSRGWLGVLIQDIDRELADSFGMEHPRGALVSQVLKESPAEAAGMRTGDIILTFNGTDILESAQLPPIVGATPVDQAVLLQILREGKRETLEIRLGELPAEGQEMSYRKKGANSGTENALGLEVADLTPQQMEEWELDSGVLVIDAPARSPIQESDIILKLNNQKVKDVSAFNRIAAQLPEGKSVAVLVERGNSPLFLAIRITADEVDASADE